MSDKKVNKKESLSDGRYVLFLVFSIIVIRSVFSFRVGSLVQTTGADEFGTIASAAFFSGLDWSAIVSANCPYYGFGYSTLFFWLFKLSDNSQFLHISMTFMNTLLLCGVGVMAYTVMRRHFKIRDKRLSFMAALASAVFFDSLVYANLIINETMLIFIIWLVLLIILEISISESFFRRTVLNVSLGIICAYSLMVHTRSIIIICAVIVTGVMVKFFSGKSPVNFFIFIPVLTGGYFLSDTIVEMVQAQLWRAGGDTVLVNSTGSVMTSLSYITRLFEPGGLRGFIYAVIGQLYMLFTLSGGVLAIGCVTGIVLFVYGFKQRKQVDKNKNIKADENSREDSGFKPFGIAVSFIFSALLATLVLNVVSALRLTPEIIMGTENPGSQKWFVYVRYNALFCSPVVMMVFAFANRYREKIKSVLNWAVVLFAAVNAGFFGFVVKYLNGVSSLRSGEFYFLFPLSNLRMGDEITTGCFVSMTIAAVIVFILIYMFMRSDMGWLAALVFIILNVYIFGFISVNIHEVNAERTRSYSDCYETVINKLDDFYDVPQIYLCRDNGGSLYAFSCQFALNRYAILEGLPDKDMDEAIVLSAKEADSRFDMSVYKRYQLADNQFMYVRGAELQAAVESVINAEFVDE